MTQKDLAKHVAKTYNLTQIVSDYLINDIFDKIKNTTKSGEATKIPGFGIFKPKTTKSRVCRDPRNGEQFDSSPKNKIIFKPYNSLKTFLNS